MISVPQRLGLIIALLMACIITVSAQAQSSRGKPRVPPGMDPGGIAVAVIGAGVDYTASEIASRLARDGEGAIIGWDFVDNDANPYADCRSLPPSADCPSHYVDVLLSHAPTVRLVPLRISTTAPATMVGAVLFAQKSPGRIALVIAPSSDIREFLLQAAQRVPTLLFVGITPSTAPAVPPSDLPDNLIIISDPRPHVVGEPIARIAARHAGAAADLLALAPELKPSDVKKRLAEQPELVRERIREIPPHPRSGGILEKHVPRPK